MNNYIPFLSRSSRSTPYFMCYKASLGLPPFLLTPETRSLITTTYLFRIVFILETIPPLLKLPECSLFVSFRFNSKTNITLTPDP
jgi:hypothetical protein